MSGNGVFARAASNSFRSTSTRILRITAVVAVAVVAIGLPRGASAATAPDYVVYDYEAETMKLAATMAVTNQAGATAGTALRLPVNGAPFRSSTTPSASSVSVRMRGDWCQGWPAATVEIDGMAIAGKLTTTSSNWADYSLPAVVTGGTHWLAIRYANDFKNAACDRTLYIDTVALHSAQAINTGTDGSLCQASDNGLAYSAPPSDISTTSLGSAPAYYETGNPSGTFLGVAAKGVMLIIHGGGWSTVGPAVVAWSRADANSWRARGWSTVNLDYRACALSVDDVNWFYDTVESQSGGLPVCASGYSAGGHLAILLAAERPNLACAIGRGGAYDLTTLGLDPAYDATTGGLQLTGPATVHNRAVAAFGGDGLAEMSPTLRVADMRARVLVGAAAEDPLMGGYQPVAFAIAYNLTHPLQLTLPLSLAAGPEHFVHARVSQAALDAFTAAETALTNSVS
jgi:acetyl esterase/lipase